MWTMNQQHFVRTFGSVSATSCLKTDTNLCTNCRKECLQSREMIFSRIKNGLSFSHSFGCGSMLWCNITVIQLIFKSGTVTWPRFLFFVFTCTSTDIFSVPYKCVCYNIFNCDPTQHYAWIYVATVLAALFTYSILSVQYVCGCSSRQKSLESLLAVRQKLCQISFQFHLLNEKMAAVWLELIIRLNINKRLNTTCDGVSKCYVVRGALHWPC